MRVVIATFGCGDRSWICILINLRRKSLGSFLQFFDSNIHYQSEPKGLQEMKNATGFPIKKPEQDDVPIKEI